MCLIWTRRERGERERERETGRAAELRRLRHAGSASAVEPRASPRGLHRCSNTGAPAPARPLLFVYFFASSHVKIGCDSCARGCSDETGVCGRGFGSFCDAGDRKQACSLASATAGRRTETNRQTKHSHITCGVMTPSPASIHSRPSKMAKLPPLRPAASPYQHSISPKAAAVSPPPIFCFSSWLLISFFPFTLALSSLPPLSPSSYLCCCRRRPVLVHMPCASAQPLANTLEHICLVTPAFADLHVGEIKV